MTHVKWTEHIEAPIEDVFELFVDVKRWPEFMPGGTEVKETTGPMDQVGTKVHTEMRFLGRKMDGWDEVVEVERPRLLKFVGEGAGMKSEATYRLTPADGGTDVVLEADYEMPGGFMGHVADRLFLEKAMERQMRHTTENFKALAEAKVTVSA